MQNSHYSSRTSSLFLLDLILLTMQVLTFAMNRKGTPRFGWKKSCENITIKSLKYSFNVCTEQAKFMLNKKLILSFCCNFSVLFHSGHSISLCSLYAIKVLLIIIKKSHTLLVPAFDIKKPSLLLTLFLQKDPSFLCKKIEAESQHMHSMRSCSYSIENICIGAHLHRC